MLTTTYPMISISSTWYSHGTSKNIYVPPWGSKPASLQEQQPSMNFHCCGHAQPFYSSRKYVIAGWWLIYPSGTYYQSVEMIIPNICKNKTCSKPPTRWICLNTGHPKSCDENHTLTMNWAPQIGHPVCRTTGPGSSHRCCSSLQSAGWPRAFGSATLRILTWSDREKHGQYCWTYMTMKKNAHCITMHIIKC